MCARTSLPLTAPAASVSRWVFFKGNLYFTEKKIRSYLNMSAMCKWHWNLNIHPGMWVFSLTPHECFCHNTLHWQHFLLMWHLLPELFKSSLWHWAVCAACPSVSHTGIGILSNMHYSHWPGELLDFACKRSLAYIWARIVRLFSFWMPRKMHKHMQWHTCICTNMHTSIKNMMTKMSASVFLHYRP